MIFALAIAANAQETPEYELPGIAVVGFAIDYRLGVHLTGAEAATDLIVSSDPGMYCGDARFERTPGPHRQCWLRGHRGDPIVLTAQRSGEYGRDWTVAWTGCEPQGDGRSCIAPITGEMEISAVLRST